MTRRQQLIAEFYRKHLHPQAHDDTDFHAAIARSDNLEEVGTVEDLIGRGADEQLSYHDTWTMPLDLRGYGYTHGYECECQNCRDCGSVLVFPWGAVVLVLSLWCCVLSVVLWLLR